MAAPLDEQSYVFVLKLWWEECESEPARSIWRGSLKNVETRRVAYFNNLEELVTYLHGVTAITITEADLQSL